MRHILIFVATSVISLLSGYLLSQYFNKTHVKAELESIAATQLALQLEALKKFDETNFSEAKFMLQSSSVGHFEMLIANADFTDTSKNKFRCLLLKRYANYYTANQLFEGKQWEEMLTIESMKSEAQERVNFFKGKLPILCA